MADEILQHVYYTTRLNLPVPVLATKLRHRVESSGETASLKAARLFTCARARRASLGPGQCAHAICTHGWCPWCPGCVPGNHSGRVVRYEAAPSPLCATVQAAVPAALFSAGGRTRYVGYPSSTLAMAQRAAGVCVCVWTTTCRAGQQWWTHPRVGGCHHQGVCISKAVHPTAPVCALALPGSSWRLAIQIWRSDRQWHDTRAHKVELFQSGAEVKRGPHVGSKQGALL